MVSLSMMPPPGSATVRIAMLATTARMSLGDLVVVADPDLLTCFR
jgi:hypothetical protein